MSNPYLDEFRQVTRRAKDLYYTSLARRAELIRKYSFAIPNNKAITYLASIGPIIEVGAGNGYWASLVLQANGNILPTDINPIARNRYTFQKSYCSISLYDAVEAAKQFSSSTLFMCWPEMEAWPTKALRTYLDNGGNKLIYIGEAPGGATGEEALWELMETGGCTNVINIPQWPGVHDVMNIVEF